MLSGKWLLNRIIWIAILFFSVPRVEGQSEKYYESRWKVADSLIQKGLTRSALSEVVSIYKFARKKGNSPQMVRALLYEITLKNPIEEDAQVQGIDSMEMEISRAAEPERALLESLTAGFYLDYFRENRYRIYGRTPISGYEKNDPTTWSIQDFNRRIRGLYTASLEDANLLKKIPVEAYSPVLQMGNQKELRPTLFDFLSHQALDYFKTEESGLPGPGTRDRIENPMAFAPAAAFSHTPFPHPDTIGPLGQALQLYQHLIAFHLRDKNPDALIDIDLDRLAFVYAKSNLAPKNSLYLEALRHIGKRYAGNPASSEAFFQIAQFYFSHATSSPSVQEPYSVAEAKILLDSIIERFPQSRGGIEAYNLRQQILHPNLRLLTEKVNVPDLPFRALVHYKNLDSIFCRIIPLTEKNKKYLLDDWSNDSIFSKLAGQNPLRAWTQVLPGATDFQDHSVEIKIDPLPVGQYILLSSMNSAFSLSHNGMAAAPFYVSSISYVQSGNHYFVLDRTSGRPLAHARIKIYKERESSGVRKNRDQHEETLYSDAQGFFKLPDPKARQSESIRMEITYQKDRLFLEDYQDNYAYSSDQDDSDEKNQEDYDDDHAHIYLFTDRSIYRPGQRVYFKGIGITQNWLNHHPQLLETKDTLEVDLLDANNQKVDSLEETLNAFGSFHGSFTIPLNHLTGRFQIQVPYYDNSWASFSVEEYKRPTFYTDFDKVKTPYRINDTVRVKGIAMAYAGNPLDGAKVTYRVTRMVRFYYSWLFDNWRPPYSAPEEIAHGTLVTAPDGSFEVAFKALPDPALDPKQAPVFQYQVQADVTDRSGETRSGNIQVAVGYEALNLQIGLANESVLNLDSLPNISLSAQNLSGVPVNLPATVRIYPLKAPGRLIRERYWEAPDFHLYSKEEYTRYFPHDEYDNELDKRTWPLGPLCYSRTDSTFSPSGFSVKDAFPGPGWYEIQATALDPFGKPVKDIRYIEVFDPKSTLPPSAGYLWVGDPAASYRPGDTLRLTVASGSDSLYLIQEFNQTEIDPRKAPQSTFSAKEIDFHPYLFKTALTAADRGGFTWNAFCIRDNRFYYVRKVISVPWTNKTLHISFDTYRDKSLPGSRESWKLSVRGSEGEKVAAEMLASMYDASLDQFLPHNWVVPPIWPVRYGQDYWSGYHDFTEVNSFVRNPGAASKDLPEKSYPSWIQPISTYGYEGQYQSNLVNTKGRLLPEPQLSEPSVARLDEVVTIGYGSRKAIAPAKGDTVQLQDAALTPPIPYSTQVRKDFRETAFFFPQLTTDTSGNIQLDFSLPESVTRWKLMTLAHTRDLDFGFSSRTLITQKQLMVQANPPRFLRQGDTLLFPVKIVNLSEDSLEGTVSLRLTSASTGQPEDTAFENLHPVEYFSVQKGRSTESLFRLVVPLQYQDALTYQVVAETQNGGEGKENFSDGEQASLPVLTNRMLVTESLPLEVQGTGDRTFTFDKLLHLDSSPTLSSYGLTVEYTANPAWYAVQALPFLIDDPYECAEQVFNRYYSNALGAFIVRKVPDIAQAIKGWKSLDSTSMKSPLEKNESLKSVLLQQTPWVLESKTQEGQKAALAQLLNSQNLQEQLKKALNELKGLQTPEGGFAWFRGGPVDRYITQYILSGAGHLEKLGALSDQDSSSFHQIISRGLSYADREMQRDYRELERSKVPMQAFHLTSEVIQYLYMRSFFQSYPLNNSAERGRLFYLNQARRYWLKENPYFQAMIALVLYRSGQFEESRAIMKSLKENAVENPVTGMYFKALEKGGYGCYDAPIESQALMVEAFSEIVKDPRVTGQLRVWLLKNKQTHHWATTKATADACYALLMPGAEGIHLSNQVSVTLGALRFPAPGQQTEARSGYFMARIPGGEVKPSMGNIRVRLREKDTTAPASQNENPSWGAVYWQYFEDLDKITPASSPLSLSRKLFLEKDLGQGPILYPLSDGDSIHVGDRIDVRIVLKADRDMEYVHMKDMRASGLEPVNVLSGYRYKDGLGYYEATRDASTDFFFSTLPRGTYVFEYTLLAAEVGNFGNGISTIQCMYAPEFGSHSEGLRLRILP